jgi:general secretion pathway protein D
MRQPTAFRLASFTGTPRKLCAGLLIVALFGCQSNQRMPFGDTRPVDGPATSALTQRAADAQRLDASATGPAAPLAERVAARRGAAARNLGPAPLSADPAVDGRGVTLSFTAAPLQEVLQATLGDVMGASFVVDPGIDGTVTLQTVQPLDRDALLPLLEAILAGRGLRLISSGGFFRVARVGSSGAGGGVVIPTGLAARALPLRHVAAAQMRQVLEPLLPGATISALPGAVPVLVVSGDAAALDMAADTVAALDIDPLAGHSMMLVGLTEADPEAVAAELEGVFAAAGGADGGLGVVPIARLNALVLLARDEAQLDRAYDWVRRLDRRRGGVEQRLYVYNVQHRKAPELAHALDELFQNGSAPATSDTAVDESAPSSGVRGVSPSSLRPSGNQRPTRVIVDAARNALLISASADDYLAMREVLRQLDMQPLQVLIEANILEVELGDTLRFGVQYAIDKGDVSFGLDSDTTSGLAASLPGAALRLFGTVTSPHAVIDALSSVTDVNVVSSPKILVVDGGTARLQVGDSVPIVTRQTTPANDVNTTTVNAVEYRETGVMLQVVPRINNSGTVGLEIVQEVSDAVATDTSTINSPTIRQRQLSTSVSIRTGQTITLGGLIREQARKGNSGVPVLSDIPVLGALFSNRSDINNRSELLVMLTPTVVAAPDEVRDISEQVRRRFEGIVARQGRTTTLRAVPNSGADHVLRGMAN